MWQNMGREIQLKRREMAFPWISVGGNYGMRRNHGREIQFVDFSRRKWREAEELGAIRPCSS